MCSIFGMFAVIKIPRVELKVPLDHLALRRRQRLVAALARPAGR